MKTIAWTLLFSLLCLFPRLSAAESFRTDINPALIYWNGFAALPDMESDDAKYLFESEWRNRPIDERAADMLAQFDPTFRMLRRAGGSRVPCDWGVDLTLGPEAMLPQLAKAKRCAQAAVLRSRWFMQEGKMDAARDDLIAVFVLGRNVARDNILISAMVQFAIEDIVTGYIAQQWPVLKPALINELLAGFDEAPPRIPVAATVPTERQAFHDWLVKKIQEIQAAHPNDDKAAVEALTKLVDAFISQPGQSRRAFAEEMLKAAGNSSAGFLAYVHQLEPLYLRLEEVAKLPYSRFLAAAEAFNEQIGAHPNLLVHEVFPVLTKARMREFRAAARLAMLRAAYEHRLDPVNGLRKAPDPFGSGPFAYSRFTLDGETRGFQLSSALAMRDSLQVLIFAEKPGPAFYIDGVKAGQKVP